VPPIWPQGPQDFNRRGPGDEGGGCGPDRNTHPLHELEGEGVADIDVLGEDKVFWRFKC